MSRIGQDLIESLRDFHGQLIRGEAIPATLVQRYETPDGPMHVRTPILLPQRKKDSDDGDK